MKLFRVTAILAVIVSIILPANAVYGQSVGCVSDSQFESSALVQLQPESTAAYVKAGLIEDAHKARLYVQDLNESGDAPCEFIGEVTLTNAWQGVGNISSITQPTTAVLHLVVDALVATSAAASRPSIILTGEVPPCDLRDTCLVTYADSAFELSPRKISLNTDTLRVGQLLSIKDDQIREVIYSVDGKQVYKKKLIEPFNERYVAGGEHSLERTAVLESGQTLTDKRILSKGSLADPGYWLTSTITRFSKLLMYAGIVGGSFILGFVWVQIARYLHRRRMWKLTHTAPSSSQRIAIVAHKPHKFDGSIIGVFSDHKRLFFAPFAGLLIVVFIFTYILNVFTVDGISMEPTLRDTSRRLLFLAPAQLGKLNGNGYIPSRGSIVVVEKDENNLFDENSIQQKDYVVKRIIGLPEDRVVISGGVIKIFNNQHKDGFVPDEESKWIKDTTGSEYIKLDITLQQNELFVVGDNRDNSIDSRYYGPIQASKVVGKVL